jgi:FdhD protein
MTVPFTAQEFRNGTWRAEPDHLPMEMPVTLTVNGEEWLEFLCTPEHLDALAVGFLFNEGMISSEKDVEQVRICFANDNVDVWTKDSVKKPIKWRRTSGCGGIGSAQSRNIRQQPEKIMPRPVSLPGDINAIVLTPPQIKELIIHLYQEQKMHRKSGGLHASALSDSHNIFLSCEDIGRHNTLDKLTGRFLLENFDSKRCVLLTTGRISSEMLQKAARLGTCIVISCTAATDLAVQMAEAWGITLVGYARDERFTVYAHSERIAV